MYQFCREVGLNIYDKWDGGPWPWDFGVYKHLRHPVGSEKGLRIEVRPQYRVVYLVGDPINAVISLFSRNFARFACSRLTCDKLSRDSFNESWELRDYLEHGKDLFQLEEHFDNWVNCQSTLPYPILVVKYEQLETVKEQVCEFLMVDSSDRNRFPTIRDRSSNSDNLSNRDQELFESIYGELRERILRLPDTLLRPAGQKISARDRF